MTPMCMLPNDHYENYNLKSNKQKIKNTTKSHTSQEGQVAGISLQPSGKLSYITCIKIAFGPPELSRYAPAQVWQEDSSQEKKLIFKQL